MSQSPETALRVQRYEDGWEIINRMIREDMSWGGYERKCLHAACGDGTYAAVSAASGIDFLDDGRALCIADFDEDGRPDLALRNRTAPQVRILRNVWPHPGPAVWLRLEGAESNRDAVGARVTMKTQARTRVKEVTAGNAFLSQSSRWLCFGLGREAGEARFEVRWPSGRKQDLGPLAPGRRYTVREGAAPSGEPFRQMPPAGPLPASSARPVAPGGAVATWLIEPLAAPNFVLPVLRPGGGAGVRLAVAGRTGKPRLVHFASLRCPACTAEAGEMRSAERALERAGAEVVHVLVDLKAEPREVEGFLERSRFSRPVLQADETALRAWNILHRHVWNRRRDLAVPAIFLLDENGFVVKVYRGGAPASLLEADVRRIPRDAASRTALALPFPGKVFRPAFRRDPLALGNAYFEAGLADLARATFEGSLSHNVADVDSLFNYAMALSDAGNLEEAARAYERVLQAAPHLDDARNNLGIIKARTGDRQGAQATFQAIVERNPAHAEAVLNVSNALLEEGRAGEAVSVCRRAIAHDGESAPFHRQLGYALYQSGDRKAALESYRRALTLDPADLDAALGLAILLFAEGDPGGAKRTALEGLERREAHPGLLNALGMAQDALGETEAAVGSLRKAIALDPGFDRPYTNLAKILIRSGQRSEAEKVLASLLEQVPGHPQALELLGGEKQ